MRFDADPFEPELLLAQFPILYAPPAHVTEISSWHQHLPFAFWCIASLRPSLFVELGTHKGDSYAAFCQAVDALGLATRCFAVDSWRGDDQAGRYGQHILEELRHWHDPRYGRFSTLLPSLFDDAVDWFADGSIDLLHIDGAHGAEAVRHDYRSWLPKLSPHAVVLFHDVTVVRQGFGVGEVWRELASRHPSLLFRHGHGLGAIAPGAAPPPSFLQLAALDPARRERLERLFHHLGRAAENHGVKKFAGMRVRGAVKSPADAAIDAERARAAACARAEVANGQAALAERLRQARERVARLAEREAVQVLALQERDAAFRVAYADTAVPAAAKPVASILIAVHDGWQHTIRCLDHIAANTHGIDYEIIVVDDRSNDGTHENLALRRDIVLLRNERNLGYLRSCNRGADRARGEFLVLLNNDTLVQPGWLHELLATFAAVPEAGLVGAQLVYPDGRLQEAGAVIFDDGSGWNFGRGDDPDRPAYRYRRDVDYCSAACAAIPLALWQRLGGFDERYLPAYCEDTDLAFRVRAAGLRVLYQPAARVVHVEGASHGTDPAAGLKAGQVVNQRRLYERWADTLQDHGRAGPPTLQQRERRAARRALVVAGGDDAGPAIGLLQAQGFTVKLMCDGPRDAAIERLERDGVECLVAPYTTSLTAHLEEVGDVYDLVLLGAAEPGARAVLARLAKRAKVHELGVEAGAIATGFPE